MNPLQMALQIRKELRALVWDVGSGDVVFGDRGVLVYAGGLLTEEQVVPGFPFALVVIESGTPDSDHPELIEQGFTVLTAAEVAGDPMGEFAVIGGSAADLGKSANRGVAEIAARVRSAVEDLVGVDGAKVILSSTSTGGAATVGRGRHIAFDELGLTAWCTSALHYAAPQQLDNTSDTWTWQGAHCSDRFDFLQYRLMYKTGSTPPDTPGDADDVVYTGTAATTTHTAVVGRAYSVFADYNARGGSSVEGSSLGSEVGAYLTT